VKILVVKMSALGDVIQALPVIGALRNGVPDVRIDWLVEEIAAPIVQGHEGVDRVLVSHRGKWGNDLRDPRRWLEAAKEIRELVRELRGQHYDLAIDLQGLLKSGIWMGLASAGRKLGYEGSREGSDRFLTERVPRVSLDVHAVERYLLLAEAAGGKATGLAFGLRVSREARDRLVQAFDGLGWGPRLPYVVMIPGARWPTKRWETESFAALGDRFVAEWGLGVAIAGSEGDRSLARSIVTRMRHPALDLTGRTDLPLLVALLGDARMVVSTDSGPMHLAAALGTPVVAVFGPTAPWRTGPYGKRHRVVRSGLACSPCFRRKCSSRRCMESITPERVACAIEEAMRETQTGMREMDSMVRDRRRGRRKGREVERPTLAEVTSPLTASCASLGGRG
jgi:heptosyltransferase I